MARLFIFAGLPGTGKSALSKRLAQKVNAVHLRIDTIEQALRDLCHLEVEGEGYRLAYRIAADNLRLGTNVVADSCNPIELTRAEWEAVAKDSGSLFVNIELVCSDTREHRRRIEARSSEVSGLKLPTWRDVVEREVHPWSRDRIVIDTAKQSEEKCLEKLMIELANTRG
jgi:predicted kinase